MAIDFDKGQSLGLLWLTMKLCTQSGHKIIGSTCTIFFLFTSILYSELSKKISVTFINTIFFFLIVNYNIMHGN